MRIIAGIYKGRPIKMPKRIRPTQDKVRKALFDILGNIEGLSFLELFAGTGAVGLEAASRGAQEVVFVENQRECLRKIRENLSVIGLSDYRVIGLDVLEALEQLNNQGKKFNIIFMDPPYYRGIAKKTLQTLSGYDILAPNGLIVTQHFKKDILPDIIGNLTVFREASYGDTVLSFYKKAMKPGTVPGVEDKD